VTCPKCGGDQAVTVKLGVFCKACYLVDDGREQRWRTEPDPVSIAIATDPELVAAREAEANAKTAYDEATETWKAAIGELGMVRILARGDNGEFHADGGWRPSRKVKDLARKEKQFVEAIPQLEKARERAGEDLLAARLEAYRVYAVVSNRHGRPVDIPNTPGGSEARLTSVISSFNL
jgi:hypothetical protein